MGINQIGLQGANQLRPNINLAQPSGGPALVARMNTSFPVTLLAAQAFVLPAGQYQVNPGRYTDLQWYDTVSLRWRTYVTQPGQPATISSDGQNYRIANTTGTAIGAVITNVGANLTNGYNPVTVTPNTGNSTWGTLVGGSVNTTVTVTTGGNFSLPPIIVWQPGSNQGAPYLQPTFTANLNSNGTINTVSVVYGGAGLASAGTIQALNQPGDNYPGGANISLNATLTNSGNLTAMWPLTMGNTGLTAVPTFTFNPSGPAATAIMNFTVSNFTVTTAGGNLGVSQPIAINTANGIVTATQNAALTGSDYAQGLAMPRPAWIVANSGANANGNSNVGVIVQDAGFHLQAVPVLFATPANSNGSIVTLPILAATVGGITDTSYLQPV